MPWKETCPMEEKRKYIADWLKREWNVSDLCRQYGISRKTGYKWIERYQAHGREGLADKSQAPKEHPNATPEAIEEALVSFRKRYPHWGPKKLLHRLGLTTPEVAWPAASTVGEILKQRGLSEPRKRKVKTPAQRMPLRGGNVINEVWAADFKGWFRTGDGRRVDPLTVTDWASRYLIGCQGLGYPSMENVRKEFEKMFREYGLPQAIRTDNGAPFGGAGLGGLSRLSAWWARLGIRHERIRPSHPEENGRHERMHRTLKAETASPPRRTMKGQQNRFDMFRREYNEERPHESLEMKTPAEVYRASERQFPNRLPDIEYGAEYQVRQVRTQGTIKWAGSELFLSESLIGEAVGLRQIDNNLWGIHFGAMFLGVLNDSKMKIQKV